MADDSDIAEQCWIVVEDEDGFENIHIATNVEDGSDGLLGDIVATCFQDMATARMIAAAPALVNALKPFMPITIRENQDYAEVAFGDHQSQAMTTSPADWVRLLTAYALATGDKT